VRRPVPAALAVVAIWVFLLIVPVTQAQYTEGLPPGILDVEVDGQAIDSATVPVTNNATPEISGRVDLGVASLDLAVANGNVIRFQAQVDDRGRFRASVPQSLTDGQYTLYISDNLIGSFTVSGALPEERKPGELLDIARVVPYPADFGDQIPGLGFLDGRFYTIEEEALRTAASNGGSTSDARATQRGLAEAGWLQRYENRLAAPSADDPTTFSVQISSFVVEYASGADARTAFAALVGNDTGIEFPTVGNESVLTMLNGTTPDTNVSYQAARLVFRLGSMLGMIVYADLTNQQPDLDLLNTVAQSVAARGVIVADRQTVPLGSMALRLDPSNAVGRLTRRDIYDIRAGTLTALYNEDDAARESRVELLTGTTDAFVSTTSGVFAGAGGAQNRNRTQEQASATEQETPPAQPSPTSVISIEGESPGTAATATPSPEATSGAVATPSPAQQATAQVFMISALYAFPGAGEADTWLTAERDRLVANPQFGGATLKEVPDGPTLGDATVTFSSVRPFGASEETVNGYRIYSRVDAIVAVIEIGSIPELPLREAAGIMEQQLACIEAQGCAGPAALPANLFGERERPTAPKAGSAAPATPTSALPPSESVIIVAGGASTPTTTNAPSDNREPKSDRDKKKDKNKNGQSAANPSGG
jgi:hypothetical protein